MVKYIIGIERGNKMTSRKKSEKLRVAKVLSEERKKKENHQKDLAKYCGVSKSAVSKWESGLSYPSIPQLPLIADYYGITIQKLLTGREKQ